MDRGISMFPAPRKEEMPYVLTQGRAKAVLGISMLGAEGRSQTVSEGVYGKQSLFWPRSS